MTDRIEIEKTPLDGVLVVRKHYLKDGRGFFGRLFCQKTFRNIGFPKEICQINHTLTTELGTVRGMHFQHPPHAEIKYITCLRGEVYDVVVDVRKGSPTFLQWYGQIISSENKLSILVPKGFAHGFQTLTNDCELLYMHSEDYQPDSEDGLRPIDPSLGIKWPLEINNMSTRDQQHQLIDASYTGIQIYDL